MTVCYEERVSESKTPGKRHPKTRVAENTSARLATAAHELRGPAAAIILFAELLEEELGGRLNPAQQELLSSIRLSSELMLKRIDEFTAASR